MIDNQDKLHIVVKCKACNWEKDVKELNLRTLNVSCEDKHGFDKK